MSYREKDRRRDRSIDDLDRRRQRSRSRERSSSRERPRNRSRRDESRDRSDRPSRPNDDRDRQPNVDDFGRDTSISTKTVPPSDRQAKNLAKMQDEVEKQARLALVKRLTATGNESDEEDGPGAQGMNEDDENYDVEEDMMALMGFKGFDTTKGKVIEENLVGAAAGGVAKHKKRVYRQYMNRKGGFNRPLQKIS